MVARALFLWASLSLIAARALSLPPCGCPRSLNRTTVSRSSKAMTLTGKGKGDAPAHGTSVLDVAFSPDSKQVATACKDGAYKIWDINVEYAARMFRVA